MKNIFNFRFLISPSNPRLDPWIGQAFSLSYLNSQPGNSYLFRYKPYGAADSRVYPGPRLANRGKKPGGEADTVYAQRIVPDNTAFKRSPVEYAIRRRMEALFSRGFHANLQTATALVFHLINMERTLKDTQVDIVSLLDRISQHDDPVMIREMLGDRVQINDDAITLTQMLIGHMRRFNNPESLRLEYTLADRELLHKSMLTMHYRPFVKEAEGIRVNPDHLGTQRDQVGIFYTGYDTGFRPQVVHDAIDSIMLLGQGEERFGWISPIIPVADEPDNFGIIGQVTVAHAEDRIGIAYEDPRFGGQPDNIGVVNSHPLYANQPDKIGVTQELTHAEKWFNEHSVIERLIRFASNEIQKDAAIEQDVMRVELQKSTDARVDTEMVKVYGAGIKNGRYDLQHMTRVSYGGFAASTEGLEYVLYDGPESIPINAIIDHWIVRGTYFGSSATIDRDVTRSESVGNSAWPVDYAMTRVEKIPMSSRRDDYDFIRVDLLPYDARYELDPTTHIDERLSRIARLQSPIFITMIEKLHKDMRYEFVYSYTNVIPQDARVLEEASIKTEKIEMAAWLIDQIVKLSPQEKISLIERNWEAVDAMQANSWIINNPIFGWYNPNLSHDAYVYETSSVQKAEKESIINPTTFDRLLADRFPIESVIYELIDADRPEMESLVREYVLTDRILWPNPDPRPWEIETGPAIIIWPHLADRKPDKRSGYEPPTEFIAQEKFPNIGVVESLIIASNEMKQERPAYVPVERYRLVGDLSEWEDIWKRYSPGLDVLDPPDADYDYSKLANQVYDPETGVPLAPIGPTNKPEVKVKIPLHHPIPSNANVGVGIDKVDKDLAIDNYILMDTILAVESIKNRNKLRYAGMPAEKTMREVMSNLYAWIQQSAPGVYEYERMFRFVRWYAEATVMKLSTYILQRVYKSWISGIHENHDLGIPYESTGWRYMPNALVIQTTDTYAILSFNKTNYVDGQIIVRGYFDNPLGEGTMEVKVDGTTIVTHNANGAFTVTHDIPAGHHDYDIVFNGVSGRVSLSSIEISGCEFVSATTIADDSDTNGLKACTTLMQMLLLYFDRHHGDGKKKGTMAVKQRKLWTQM